MKVGKKPEITQMIQNVYIHFIHIFPINLMKLDIMLVLQMKIFPK